MGMRTRDFFVTTGSQLIGSTTILSRDEKLVLENHNVTRETPETKVHQTGTSLPYFRVTRIVQGEGIPECWIGRRQVHVLMMMGSSDEWTDPHTGHLWVNDEKTTTLVEEGDSRVSWYRGVPCRKVEPGEKYGQQRTSDTTQASGWETARSLDACVMRIRNGSNKRLKSSYL